LGGEFKFWYAKQVCRQFKGECEKASIYLHLSVVKPVGAEWMKNLYSYIKSKPHIVIMVSRHTELFKSIT